MTENCKNCSEKQACVPFFIHENAMMHKDADNERMAAIVERMAKIVRGQRIANIIKDIVMLLVVFIFVWFYTSRAQIWSNTITEMKEAIIEVTNAKDTGSP